MARERFAEETRRMPVSWKVQLAMSLIKAAFPDWEYLRKKTRSG